MSRSARQHTFAMIVLGSLVMSNQTHYKKIVLEKIKILAALNVTGLQTYSKIPQKPMEKKSLRVFKRP
ncbi:MAG: hypothetical protein WAM42_01860 [Candidatus Nitrosopolaris sp.]